MPLDRTIDVSVPHALSTATAFDRVIAWLNSRKGDAKHIRTLADEENLRITSVSEAHGKRVTLNIRVTGSQVELHSDPIDGKWIEMAVIAGTILFNEGRIYSQLTDALKP